MHMFLVLLILLFLYLDLILFWIVTNLIVYVEGDFLLNKINFVGGDKLLPVFKHGFLRSEENVFPAFLYTQNVYGKMLSFTILNSKLWMITFSHTHFGYIKMLGKHFLQTWGSHVWKLAKACLLLQNWSCSRENHLLHYKNKMRSLHLYTNSIYFSARAST